MQTRSDGFKNDYEKARYMLFNNLCFDDITEDQIVDNFIKYHGIQSEADIRQAYKDNKVTVKTNYPHYSKAEGI